MQQFMQLVIDRISEFSSPQVCTLAIGVVAYLVSYSVMMNVWAKTKRSGK